jgi:hypothetical protein
MLSKAVILCITVHVAMQVGCATEPAQAFEQEDPAGGKADVYGTDDRKERYQFATTSLEHQLAMSSAMVSYRGLMKERTDGDYDLYEPRTLAQTGVCADERFANQPEVGFCSATLIAPDVVVTSGHCMMNSFGSLPAAQLQCQDIYIVFDFAYDAKPSDPLGELRVLSKDKVFECVDVLAAENPENGMLPKQDYAILQLDRAVDDREPLPVYGGAGLADDAHAIQIGHPSGLPQKLAPAMVRGRLDPSRYAAYEYESDILGGNSGGGVFTTNGTLFGIPTRYSGENYVLDTSASPECYRTAVCGENAECPLLPGAYDTATMLDRIPDELKQRFTIATK